MRRSRRKENHALQDSSVANADDALGIPFAQRLSCTIAEACEATGLGRSKLYELIGAGCLATTTVGRRRLVLVHSLRKLLEGSTSQAVDA